MNMSFSLSEPRSYLGTAVMFGLMFALPTWQAGLLAGELLVQLRGDDAVVVGPRMYVRRLLTRLEG